MNNLRVSIARVSIVKVSVAVEFQREFQQPHSFNNTLIKALWFRFETWFVVLVFSQSHYPYEGSSCKF
jgi:hypothetical protein